MTHLPLSHDTMSTVTSRVWCATRYGQVVVTEDVHCSVPTPKQIWGYEVVSEAAGNKLRNRQCVTNCRFWNVRQPSFIFFYRGNSHHCPFFNL